MLDKGRQNYKGEVSKKTIAEYTKSIESVDVYKGTEVQLFNEEGLPKTTIIGVIIALKRSFLKKEISSARFIKYKFDFRQSAEITSNRHSRLFYHKLDAQVIPLYDHLGNVLWPEKIPYEKVKEIIQNRAPKT